MPLGRIGIQVAAPDAPTLLAQIERAEGRGIEAVWATSDPVDSLNLMSAAAVRTQHLLLGTAITRAATRHPIGMAQQAAAVAQLAPGRFRLGLGPIHPSQAAIYGRSPSRPLAHFSSYIRAVKALLRGEAIEVNENGVFARGRLASLPSEPPPVMLSALRAGSFRVCGEVADGAITWVCPLKYSCDVALPAIASAAAGAGREPPPLVHHAPVFLSTDRPAVVQRMREHFAFYLRNANYLAMFAAAGFPEAAEQRWSEAMVEAVAVYGTESDVAGRLQSMFDAGIAELLVTPMSMDAQDPAGADRVLNFLAELKGR